MAITYKVLAQVKPEATTATTLYTVATATSAVCSTLAVCNTGTVTTFRVAVRPGGASLEDKHYIVYDNFVNGNDTAFMTLGITLAATDVITVYSGTANLSFNLFGSEVN